MKERRETKATLLTVGGSVLVWGIQQGIQGGLFEAGASVVVAAVAFWLYEHVALIEKNELAEQVLSDLSDEEVKQLIKRGSDAIREAVEDLNTGQNGS